VSCGLRQSAWPESRNIFLLRKQKHRALPSVSFFHPNAARKFAQAALTRFCLTNAKPTERLTSRQIIRRLIFMHDEVFPRKTRQNFSWQHRIAAPIGFILRWSSRKSSGERVGERLPMRSRLVELFGRGSSISNPRHLATILGWQRGGVGSVCHLIHETRP
jgi:hypothetical protein